MCSLVQLDLTIGECIFYIVILSLSIFHLKYSAIMELFLPQCCDIFTFTFINLGGIKSGEMQIFSGKVVTFLRRVNW